MDPKFYPGLQVCVLIFWDNVGKNFGTCAVLRFGNSSIDKHEKTGVLPVEDFIAAVEDLRFGVMVLCDQLVSEGLQSSDLLLLRSGTRLIS